MKYFFLLLAASAMLVAGLTTTVTAGHHYHGHGCGYGMQNINDMDANQDGTLTFDEFSESHLNRLKRHFKMLDADNDELIDAKEWNQFLKWHGIEDDKKELPTG
jgi:Ca2+-binding EF-hand superfamily protein